MTQDARGHHTHPSRGGLSYSEPLGPQHSSPEPKNATRIYYWRERAGWSLCQEEPLACRRTSSWLKPDGTVIHYLRFPETVADLEEGSIVHVLGVDAIIGLPPRIASRLKIVSHGIKRPRALWNLPSLGHFED